jgi:glycosyltransferase involved in cell wall biosynthesis
MNILYVSLSYVPSRRASSVHVMRMCAAFARAGHRVRLVAKRSHEPTAHNLDDFAFYGVEPSFSLDKVVYPARRGGAIVFAGGLLDILLRHRREVDLVYARDVLGAAIAVELRLPTVLELHEVPQHPLIRVLVRRLVGHRSLRGLVAISRALLEDLRAEGMVARHGRTVVAHDAADPVPIVERDRSFPGPRIGYIGNLYPGRGVELIFELAARSPNLEFEVIGGSIDDLKRWRSRPQPPNLHLLGFAPPSSLAAAYQRFDVVLMPYARQGVRAAQVGSDTSRWASPMKMFEYMASGIPIVASDLPVLQEVLRHEHNSLIAAAGDVTAWQRAIQRLLDDRPFAQRLAQQARADLEASYTWDARARSIVQSLIS